VARAPANILPSVFDRLIDENPESRQDVVVSRRQQLTGLRNSVRRDLEALLNSHYRCISPPEELQELKQSVVEYGVKDFVSAFVGTDELREDLRKSLEESIRMFEPRFVKVDVTLIDDGDRFDRTLRFRIDALMHADPAPEPISFDSRLDPTSQSFSVATDANV
jgi:type VI secretion system protein ImpF